MNTLLKEFELPKRTDEYVIFGDPVPLARARINGTRMWDAQKEIKLAHGISLRNQHGDRPLYTGPLSLTAHFYITPPQKNAKKLYGKHHHTKPDLSNLLKFLEDIATGILYKDDALISYITALKIYDQEPKTVFFIREIKNV